MKLAYILSSVAALTSAATVPTSGGPPKDLVKIGSLTYAGSGCPSGSLAPELDADANAFTLYFDSFVASTGPGIPITENRKNCQINLGLNVPQGWQYSFATIDYKGYLNLDDGVKAQKTAALYFQGEVNQSKKVTTFTSKNNGNFYIRDNFPVETVVWSPCGGQKNINIATSVRLNGPSHLSGTIGIDSIDTKFTQIYSLQWKQC
ncbi:hypothetical protein HK099_005538 [Clydaea vesicula]|uniref:DUF4360 domain containing protein n=1 Tax=Clydaea vesicula TaxID=447962 RepID=A0AAD5XUW8_9FUNG|nr:hypothetical protein HK099_005538 [Clydaea vesicula]KAJ3393227.1 hypothetical protein HDU92_007922 [Lobulomyces angularis]